MQEWGRTNVALLNVRDHSREFSSELLQLLGKGDLKLGGGGARASITREEKLSLVQLVAQVKSKESCDSFLRTRRSSFFAVGDWTLASLFTAEPNKSRAVVFLLILPILKLNDTLNCSYEHDGKMRNKTKQNLKGQNNYRWAELAWGVVWNFV